MMNSCKPTKHQIIIGAFYTIATITGIIVPNVIAAAIGDKAATTFCNDHNDICSKYHDPLTNKNLTLPQAAKRTIYVTSAGNSLLIISCALVLLLLALLLLDKILSSDCCKKANNEKDILISPDKDHNDSKCSHFFKRCKSRILPNKSDKYRLLVTGFIFILASTAITSLTALATEATICSTSKNSTAKCNLFFSNATTTQLATVEHEAHTAFNTVIGAGTVVGAAVNVIIILSVMGLIACYKAHINNAVHDDRIEIDTTTEPNYF